MSRTVNNTSQSRRRLTPSDRSVGAENSEARRNGTYETPFVDDMPNDVSFSRSSWLGKWIDWISPDDDSFSEYLKSGAKSLGSFAAILKGVPWLIGAVKNVFTKGSTNPSANTANDAAAIAALQATGANLGSDSQSWWSKIKSALTGDSQSLNLTGLLSSLTGVGTELGSSILNFQNQVKLIDKQNEYNTPANQMARFQEAGLNPNLVYGLGSNGNQPASGSIAPVDFSTASREAKMAMLNYKSDLAQKQASINLMDKQAREADERANAQSLSNKTYMQSWFMNMNLQSQQIKESAARISNDKRRVEFEEAASKAQKALFEFQSQPGFMQKIGSAESFMNAFESFLNKLGQKMMDSNPITKQDFYWPDGVLKITGLREVDEMLDNRVTHK